MADIQPPPGGVRGVHKAPESGDKAIFFRRELFVREGGTRNSTEDRLRRERGQKSEFVKFDENLNKQYRTYLQNHAQRLIDATRKNPQLFQAIRHLPDADILTLLTSVRKNADGKEKLDEHNNPILDVSQEKIQKFLEKSQGWEITTKMIEHETAMLEFSLGLNHLVRPPATRNPRPDLRSGLPLNRDRGWLNVPVEDYIGRFLGRRVYDVAGRRRLDLPNIHIAGGYLGIPAIQFNAADIQMWHARVGSAIASVGLGAVGLALGGPVGAAVGAASPMAVEGMVRTLRGGLRMDVRQLTEAFEAISHNTENKTYLREVLQIDLDDFHIVGGVVDRARPTGRSRDIKLIQKDILENLHTREEFYTKGLEVPENNFDSSPFQTVLNYAHHQQVEALDTKMQAELVNEWKPDEGGIRDAGGLRPIDAGFNPNNLDHIGNIRRLMTAQRKVLMKEMQEFLREELQERKVIDSKGPSLEILKEKKEERTKDDGRIKKERAEGLTKRKKTLTEAKESLTTEKNSLNTYNTAVDALKKARQDAQDKYGANDVASINAVITTRENGLTDHTIVGSYAKQARALETARKKEIGKIDASIPATITGKTRINETNIRATNINARYAEQQAKLKEDVYNKVKQEVTELKALRSTIETSQRALEERQTGVMAARIQLESLRTEFSTVADPAAGIDIQLANVGLPVVNLTPAELATQPVDEIFRRIAAANTAGAGLPPPAGPVTIGWSEANLKRPEIRQRVIKAVVEARAQTTENADPTRVGRLPHYNTATNPATWNISENLLRSYSPAELIAEQTRRHAAGLVPLVIPVFTPDQAANAILEAHNRLQVRADAMTKPIEEIDEQLKQIDHDINYIDLKGEVAQIDAAVEVVKRKDYIYEQAASIRINRNRFVDTAVIAVTDVEYTTQERAVATRPKGYFEMLDLMFGYKSKAERGGYFEEIQKVLPPRKLAEVLHNSFGYPAGVVNADENVYLTNVFNRMQTDMTARRMSTVRLQRAMRAVIHRLEDEALALA